MSTAFQPGASRGPENSEPSTTTRVTGPSPARRARAASVASRGAPSYVVGSPPLAADSVPSPPPTSTTSPGRAPATSRVASRRSGGPEASTATAVTSLAVDAGSTYVSADRSSSTSPVSASTTVAVTRPPSRGSASGPASIRATPPAVCAGPSTAGASTGGGAGGVGVGMLDATGGAAAGAAAGGSTRPGPLPPASATRATRAIAAVHRRSQLTVGETTTISAADPREPRRTHGVRRHDRDPEGRAEQVRVRPPLRADPAGSDPVHGDAVPGRLRLHRGDARRR